ncbi:MAG: T9SS type A sorting domain-containing protein [Bacteroidia bacterium]|nr:T9SS type A sorting domain-containing protein [Bacteroidia bacterium]
MKKTILTLLFNLWAFQTVFAQMILPSGKLYVLNEGSTQHQGSLGYISYPSLSYIHIDSIPSFGNDLFIDAATQSLYVCVGDGTIRKYNTAADTLVWISDPIGARSAKVYQNDLVVACSSAPFAKVLKTQDGSIKYSIPTTQIANETESVVIIGNKAYLTENGYGGWGVNGITDSTVVVLNLDTQSFQENITVAKNPNKIIEQNNHLYVQCLDYVSGMTVSEISLPNHTVINRHSSFVSYGGFTANSSMLYFGIVGSNPGIGTYSFANQTFNQSFSLIQVYGLEFITNDLLIISETDFFSTGSVSVFDLMNGSVHHTVSTHISPRAMAFLATGTVSNELSKENEVLWYYSNKQLVAKPTQSGKLEIYSMDGRLVLSQEVTAYQTLQIFVNDLPNGVYVCKFGKQTLKFYHF